MTKGQVEALMQAKESLRKAEELINSILKEGMENEQNNFETEVKNTKEDIEKIVREYLKRLAVPSHILGYDYLNKAIRQVVDDPDTIYNITKTLYPTIARKCNTTPSKVERAIRHAIEISYSKGENILKNKVFGCTISSEIKKPTNSQYISSVAEYVRLNHHITK